MPYRVLFFRVLVILLSVFITTNPLSGQEPASITDLPVSLPIEQDTLAGMNQSDQESRVASVVVTRIIMGFNKGPVVSPAELITGRLAGLMVTSKDGSPHSEFLIRSLRSSVVQYSLTPLIIVDNVPLISTPFDIEPHDIESISWLNNGPADIYGGQAANGALIVTTKKGSKDLKLTYTCQFSISTIQKKYDVFGADEFRTLVNDYFSDDPEITGLLGEANTDWQDEIFTTAVSHDHHLSISGSLKTIPYRFSFGKAMTQGTIETANYDRSSLSASLNPHLFDDHLNISLNIRGVLNNNRIPDTRAVRYAAFFDPTQPVYSGSNIYGGYTTKILQHNPVALLDLADNRLKSDHLTGNIMVDYKLHFLPQLKIVLNVAADDLSSRLRSVTDTAAAWYMDGFGRITDDDNFIKNRIFNTWLNYTSELKSNVNKIDVTAGYSLHHMDFESDYNYARLTDPEYYYDREKLSNERSQITLYGQVIISFLERYTLTTNLQNNKYSEFSPDNRSGLSVSVNAEWDITRESFMKSSGMFHDLKLYLGYGKIGAYRNDILPTESNGFSTNIQFNSNFKPEQKTYRTLGLRFEMFDCLSGNINAYYNSINDLVLGYYIPFGGTNYPVLVNSGELGNSGIEFTLDAIPFSRSDLFWSLRFTSSLQKNKIVDLGNLDYIETGRIPYGIGNYIQRQQVGHPVNSFYMMKQVYDSEGNPVEGLFEDQTGEGTIDYEDRYHYKTSDPVALMSIYSYLAYKEWEMSFSGRLSLGNYVYNTESLYGNYGFIDNIDPLWNISRLVEKSQFSASYPLSDYYVENGSFFRLDYVSLGYNFKGLFGNKISCSLSTVVRNVFTITGYSGNDPEVYSGISDFTWPRARTASLEISIDF